MDLTDIFYIKNFLRSRNININKRLGQHFLIDSKVLEDIIRVANLSQNDIVVEVGPGLGVLTQELCKKAKRLISVEKDAELARTLKINCDQFSNLEIINNDILKVNLSELSLNDLCYKVVANLPYNIASPTIRYFLENKIRPNGMVLMVQREVAQKICAKPGDLNILGVSVQFYAKPETLFEVEANSFWPSPKVKSAVIKLQVYKKPLFKIDPQKFFRIIKTGFSSKRKKLLNNLSGSLLKPKKELEKIFKKINLDFGIRAQDLSLRDWYKIYEETER